MVPIPGPMLLSRPANLLLEGPAMHAQLHVPFAHRPFESVRPAAWLGCLIATAACVALAAGVALGQTHYPLTVHNNFAAGEFYGATPQNSDIWIVTNMAYDYVPSGSATFVPGNTSAGTWSTIQLSTINSGSMRLNRTTGGTRMYAVLSSTPPAAAQPSPSTSNPNNYFEWSFDGSGNPGVLDFSWIDRFDYPTRMVASSLPNNVHAGVSNGTQTFGVKSSGPGTSQIGTALAQYATKQRYAWLGTGSAGFSQSISYASPTGGTSQGAVGWVTRNQSSLSGYASGITSFTQAIDRVITTSATSQPWSGSGPTNGIGPNWLSGTGGQPSGFRVGYPSAMKDPQSGTATGDAWTAYVNFVKTSGSYTLKLSDFTLYTGGAATWTAANDASNAVYSVTQADGMLEAIWTSSWNALTNPTPQWVVNLGPNNQNVPYELYNAIASGVIHRAEFVNNTSLPSWSGYAARINGVNTYNYEIFTAGAPVNGSIYPAGLMGYLTGSDMVAMLEQWDANDTLVNPYFLELLKSQQQTPAYLYPSQDSWNFVGTSGTLGMQPQPLNGQAAWGDVATLDWYLGNNVAPVPEPSAIALLVIGGAAFGGFAWRRRRQARPVSGPSPQ